MRDVQRGAIVVPIFLEVIGNDHCTTVALLCLVPDQMVCKEMEGRGTCQLTQALVHAGGTFVVVYVAQAQGMADVEQFSLSATVTQSFWFLTRIERKANGER